MEIVLDERLSELDENFIADCWDEKKDILCLDEVQQVIS